MQNNVGAKEFWVGLFVLAGLVALFFLSFNVGNLGDNENKEGYEVIAKFENIGGLTSKSPVRMAGVNIGRVSSIEIDPEDFTAKVTMVIGAKHNNLPLDSSASILTAGLLGSQYVGVEAGAEDDFLSHGDEIEFTESAVVLEKLIGQFFLNSQD